MEWHLMMQFCGVLTMTLQRILQFLIARIIHHLIMIILKTKLVSDDKPKFNQNFEQQQNFD